MAQIAKGTYSAGDRNWRIFLDKIVITNYPASQMIGVDKITGPATSLCDAVMKTTHLSADQVLYDYSAYKSAKVTEHTNKFKG